MGIQSMQGTPWHIETLRRREGDKRRHKSNCDNYEKGICKYYNFRCPGSAHCNKYREIKISQNTLDLEPKLDLIIDNLCGTFTVLYVEDKEIVFYEIGKTIETEAPLIKSILQNNEGSIFELNGNKIKLINKKIQFRNKK